MTILLVMDAFKGKKYSTYKIDVEVQFLFPAFVNIKLFFLNKVV